MKSPRKESRLQAAGASVKSPAPAWLVARMNNLRQLPAPSIKEVDSQMSASAKFVSLFNR